MTSYPIIILLLSILFCTVTTVLAVMLKRSNSNKDKLLAAMQASLSSRREAEQDGAIFEDNLRSAELTTRLQQPRLNVQQQSHSTAPERYRYIQSMVEMGLNAQKIAATLSMSLHETTQIITLIRMANPPRQNDTSPLPLPEANDSRSNQHVWSSWTAATKNESHLNSGDEFSSANYSVPKLENDCHITPMNGISAFHSLFSCKKNKKISCKALNQPASKEHPGKNCASHQPPASAQSGVVHKSRKLARWLKIRAFPPCLRSQGSREPPRNPLPRNNNLSPAPLSGYT